LAQSHGTQLLFGTALQQLHSLHTLQLKGMQLYVTDFMAISCLTGLTELSVNNGGWGMCDAVAAAAGGQLTGLQVLWLHDYSSYWCSYAHNRVSVTPEFAGIEPRTCLLDTEGCLEALTGLSALQAVPIPRFICSLQRRSACVAAI
jgi:hypothetical protein